MDTKTQKIWPNPNEMELGWTAKYPRPEDGKGHHPAVLESRQVEWDTGEALRVTYAKRSADIFAEREAADHAKRDAVAAQAAQKRDAQRADTESMLKRRFVTAGGSESEWAVEKDAIVVEHRRRQMTVQETTDDRARAEHARIYQGF